MACIDIFKLLSSLSIADGAVTETGADAGDWDCTASSNVITCTSSTAIAASGTSVFGFQVNVDATASGTLINKGQVGGGGDPTNPNAPTGILYPYETVKAFCEKFAGVVVIDEAYVDFAARNCLDLALGHPNVIVARTPN